MKRFLVYVQERWERVYAIDAVDSREAVRMVYNGGGAEVGNSAEYVEPLDIDYWQAVEQEEGK